MLAVLYLAFNAGYSDVAFNDVAESAISLAEAVVDLMPLESEACGLLALMLMQNSRRNARLSPSGKLLTLEEQDRSLWKRSEIDRGSDMLARARERGTYVLQASIAQCHASRRTRHRRTGADRRVLRRLLVSQSFAGDLPQSGDRRRHPRGPDAGLALLDGIRRTRRLLPRACAQADLLSVQAASPMQPPAMTKRSRWRRRPEKSAQLRRRLAGP